MSDTSLAPLPFTTRLWFAWLCFFRVLFDGLFAEKVWRAREIDLGRAPAPQLEAPKPPPVAERAPEKVAERAPEKKEPALPPPPPADPALQLLALFQREGRLVDFLEQDIASFPDADVGAAARVVHEGCRKALHAHAKVAPVRAEDEGARVTIAPGFKPAEVKLSGNVAGSGPYSGLLRHRGWRVDGMKLPVPVQGYDPTIVAPAEVEL